MRAQIADQHVAAAAVRTWTASDTHRAIDAVWRIESARLIAGLARIVRDVGLAEELAQDALVAALEQWPESGVPDNPGAWLMATAKHRAIDLLRRSAAARAQARGARPRAGDRQERRRRRSRRRDRRRRRRRPAAPGVHRLPPGALDRGAGGAHAAPARRPDDRGDRARVPGPGADRRPADRPRQADPRRGARPLRGPRAAPSCAARLASVLEVDLPRSSTRATRRPPATTGCGPALCEDALRLGRILAELAPKEPEVHGLVALMEIQASRSRARVGPVGRARPAARSEPRALGPAPHPSRPRGARAGRGARAARSARTRCRPRSPPVTRGRAPRRRPTGRASRRSTTALAAAHAVAGRGAQPRGRGRDGVRPRGGPRARRRADLGAVARGYHLLPSVRGDLLAKLGRLDEARAEFERAAVLTQNARERRLLLERAARALDQLRRAPRSVTDDFRRPARSSL